MLLKIGAPCRSRGEHLGSLWGLTVEPREKLLLRAIVERPEADPLVRVKVPFGRIDRADADQVVMMATPADLESLPTHDAASEAAARRSSRRRRRGDEVVERILTGDTPVHCRDGEVGRLMAITVDARSGDLEDLSFEFGAVETRELVVSIGQVDEITDERINLTLERDELAEFPSRHA